MADTGNGKRRFDDDDDEMTAEQLEIVRANKSKEEAGPSRAVERMVVRQQKHDFFGRNTSSSSSAPLGKTQAVSQTLTTIRKQEKSLMNCPLNATQNPNEVWVLVEQVVKQMKNTDPEFNSDSKMALGNYYQHGNFCEFQMGMYKSLETSENLLDFKRMSGDGFVMDNFYRAVRKGIRESHPDLLKMDIDTTDDFENEEELNFFEDFTDSEDDGDDDEELLQYLQIGGPLNLQLDSSVVKQWIDDINNRHIEDKNHRMGLMAHNATNDANRRIIIEQGGEELNSLVQQLLASKESANAALVRNTSVLVHEMSKEINFDMSMIDAVFEALARWVPGQGRRETFRLTESRETVLNLTFVLDHQFKRGAVTLQTLQNKARARFTGNLPNAFRDYVDDAQVCDVEDEYTEQIQLLNDLVDEL